MRGLAAALAILAATAAAPASAHAIDEYLQASLLSIHQDRADVFMRLVPGVAVNARVLAGIDANADGAISQAEGRAYAHRVLDDLRIRLDGRPLRPKLEKAVVPAPAILKDGLGEIRIEYAILFPQGGSNRKLTIENHHQRDISAYLVNSLASGDPDIRLRAQRRSADQSFYELEYGQAAGTSGAPAIDAGGFPAMFRLGMRHIGEGTDHLLFLLALLLPVPLLARGSRWGAARGIRASILGTASVVTGFTLGHSVTLALAGLGLVKVPGGPIEVLIAVSILVSALHALRPLFPGRETLIAAFFGLIHGLAFAAALGRLGFTPWQRITGLLGFNLGIEAMQLAMVAAVLPSLLLLSRTKAYAPVRIGGAGLAGIAAAGWIAERLWGLRTPIDQVMGQLAHWFVPLSAGLFLSALGCWWLGNLRHATWPHPSRREGRAS